VDDPSNMDDLARIGEMAAKRQVKKDHFLPAFDAGA
jgi:hypothetical protein